MVFSPKYSEKRLICTIYFYLPDFLAPFWHRKPQSKSFSSVVYTLLYQLDDEARQEVVETIRLKLQYHRDPKRAEQIKQIKGW